MDGETKALNEPKDWISLFSKLVINFSFFTNSLFQNTSTI